MRTVNDKQNTLFAPAEIKVTFSPTHDRSLVVSSAEEIASVLYNAWDMDSFHYQEQFGVLLLNHAAQVMGFRITNTGSINSVTPDIRALVGIAIKSTASRIVIAHNHPSGSNRISAGDKAATYKIMEACALFDIVLEDHIILIGDGDFISFKERKLLYASYNRYLTDKDGLKIR
jgi:DNA repair protein RadC